MQTVILKLISMLIPVALGYFLKKAGVFGPTDYRFLTKVVLYITLPATAIASFASTNLNPAMLGIPLLAFAMNWVGLGYAALTSRGIRDRKHRAMDMFCLTGYNMGNFLIPFAQQFMGAEGVAVTALFDSGNSPMCVGGHYVAITAIVGTEGKKQTFKGIIQKLLSSPSLVVYLILIAMTLAGLRVPSPVAQICQLTGSANAFCSMFMMGLMFEVHFDASYMKAAAFALSRRYLLSVAAALGAYFLLPFDLPVRQTLVLVAFAPIPSLAAVFTENVDGDVGLASFITSCSFLISSVVLTLIIFLLGIGG